MTRRPAPHERTLPKLAELATPVPLRGRGHAAKRSHELRVEPLTRDVVDGVLVEGAIPPEHRIDLTVVAYFEDERPLRGLAAFLDWRTGGKLSRMLRSGWCTGKAGEAVLLPGARGLPSERIVLLGLGPSVGFSAAQARTAAIAAVELVHKLLPRDVLFAMPGLAEDREIVEGVFAGIVLALGGTPRVPTDEASHEDGASEVDAPANDEPPPHPQGPKTDELDADAPGHPGDPALDGAPDVDPDPEADDNARPSAEVGHARTPCRWWVIAEPRHVGRLRRVLEGPPRAAGPSVAHHAAHPGAPGATEAADAPANPRR